MTAYHSDILASASFPFVVIENPDESNGRDKVFSLIKGPKRRLYDDIVKKLGV